MITIHHLGVSQSERIVWLMEELGLPYNLVWHRRGPDNLAPPEYAALHPVAMAPVVEDEDGRRLSESGAIVDYIAHKYGDGRLTVAPDQPNYFDYLYWMHFSNSALGLFFAKRTMAPDAAGTMADLVKRREEGYGRLADDTLGRTPYLAGDALTCADIMSIYFLRSPMMYGARADLPNIRAYVDRIAARPAYIKAMQIAGNDAVPPA